MCRPDHRRRETTDYGDYWDFEVFGKFLRPSGFTVAVFFYCLSSVVTVARVGRMSIDVRTEIIAMAAIVAAAERRPEIERSVLFARVRNVLRLIRTWRPSRGLVLCRRKTADELIRPNRPFRSSADFYDSGGPESRNDRFYRLYSFLLFP